MLYACTPGKKPRLCFDFRGLNQITVKHRYPLPVIEDMLGRLHAAAVFTQLDLASGFNQIRVRPEDVYKTGFVTRYGQFETLVMPFGVCNGPSTFQEAINATLRDQLDRCAIAYMDDLSAYSASRRQHIADCWAVLSRLHADGWVCRLPKCHFFVQTMLFAGHVCHAKRAGSALPATRQANPDKVQCVQEWPVPQDVSELRRFLGLANYFGEYIEGFSQIAEPLYALTRRKGAVFKQPWSEECAAAFRQLKVALTSAPVLILPDPAAPWVLQTDASSKAIGAVLMQEVAGKLHPVAYSSHLMSAAEQRYPVHDKECLAIVHHLVKWRHHLMGGQFVLVQSDHKSLDRLMHFTDLDCLGRQARWLQVLANFNYKVVYVPGSAQVAADCLSRPQCNVLQDVHVSQDLGAWLKGALLQDSDTATMIALAQGQQVAMPRWLPSGQLLEEEGLLYVVQPDGSSQLVIPADPRLQQLLLSEAHDTVIAGHMGRDKTLAKVKQWFVWDGMAKAVDLYVRSCPVCQGIKAPNQRPAGLLQSLAVPPSRWHTVSMDFITGLPRSSRGHDSIMTVVDKLTKRAHFIPTTCTVTAAKCAELFIQHVFRLHGMPRVIVSDRDVKFTSAFWRTFHRACGTQLRMSTPFHPQTDGQSEAANKVISQLIRSCIDVKQQSWEDKLPFLEFAYNDSLASGTGFTPFFLDLGRHPHVPLLMQSQRREDVVKAAGPLHTVAYVLTTCQQTLKMARARMKVVQEQQARQANKKLREVAFAVGDQVMLSTKHLHLKARGRSKKLRPRFIGPFAVSALHGPNAVRLDLPPEVKCHRVQNVSKLKHYVSDGGLFPGRPVMPSLPEVSDSKEDFEVEAIMGRKGKAGQVQYLVKFRGSPGRPRWLPKDALLDDWDVVQEFEAVHGTDQQLDSFD
jgi:hypothetical protein